MEPTPMNRHTRRAQAAIERHEGRRHQGPASGATANGWESGPPPGRFDDAAPDPVPPGVGREGGDTNGAGKAPAEPWESLITPAPAAWFETPPPARRWLLRDGRGPKAAGLLPLGKVGQIIAEGGAGKTMAMFQLAVAVATGERWLGTFDVATQGCVLVLVGEEDREEAHRRLFRVRRAMHAPVPKQGAIVVLPLASLPCPMLERDERGNLRDAPFLAWLRSWLAAHGPWALVIVDPLSRFAGPDAEIDNAAATRFVQALESIAMLTGATVLVAHHTNKLARGRGGVVEATAGRGSSALVDGARWQVSLGVERLELEDPDERQRLGEVVTWANPKTNYSRKAEPLLLRRDLENGGALVPLDEADAKIVQSVRGVDVNRAQKQRAKDSERGTREADEDNAVTQAVRERPGIPRRELVKRVQAIAHCGPGRAEVAIARAHGRLDVREGPRKAQLHYLRGTDA